jgi:hypothetical protein
MSPVWKTGNGGTNRQAKTKKSAINGGLQNPGTPEMYGRELTSGTSIFDPVLCELLYRWFSPPSGIVYDPFAGGSVRGIVAARLGRRYVGIDLSGPQVSANWEQWDAISGEEQPTWHEGNSECAEKVLPADFKADFILSCPPYADLEVYSEHPDDISNMPYQEFIRHYRAIIQKSVTYLADDSFAAWVVGEARDNAGHYYGLVPDTIKAFQDAGLSLYNEAILVTMVASLPVRVSSQFDKGRKLGKTHQNVLVFLKGDAKRAVAKIGSCERGEILDGTTEEN